MDNITQQMYDAERARTVQLTPSQYSFYQKNYIELLDPDGGHLELVGRSVQRSVEEDKLYRLREQVVLLQALLANITEHIELPALAVAGLADLMFRMQGVCEKT